MIGISGRIWRVVAVVGVVLFAMSGQVVADSSLRFRIELRAGDPIPSWSPPPGAYARYRYRYYPEYELYFDPDRSLYFYYNSGRWYEGPRIYPGVTLGTGFVLLYMNYRSPYRFHDDVRRRHRRHLDDSWHDDRYDNHRGRGEYDYRGRGRGGDHYQRRYWREDHYEDRREDRHDKGHDDGHRGGRGRRGRGGRH